MSTVVKYPNLASVAEAVLKGAVRGLDLGAKLIAGRAIEIVRGERFATGHLSQTIHGEVLPPRGTTLMAVTSVAAPYGPFVEFDTKPHVPPFKPIYEWVVTKQGRGMLGQGDPVKIANAIRFGRIRKYGTKGIHFMERAYLERAPQAVEVVGRSIAAALKSLRRI